MRDTAAQRRAAVPASARGVAWLLLAAAFLAAATGAGGSGREPWGSVKTTLPAVWRVVSSARRAMKP